MKTETITYFDDKQKLIGELIYDETAKQPQPAVIVFHAIEGRGSFTVDYAQKIAGQGFAVFVADIYGNGEVANTMDEGFKLITPFLQDRNLVRRRALLAYETLLQQHQINKHKIGAIGFCFGGMCVLELLRSGAHLHAAVLAHAVLQKSDLPTHAIKAAILALHGYQDPQVPPETLKAFAQELDEAGVKDWTFTYFGHAKHSFTDPKTGTFDAKKEQEMGRAYDPIAAARTFRYAVDFFHEHLQK